LEVTAATARDEPAVDAATAEGQASANPIASRQRRILRHRFELKRPPAGQVWDAKRPGDVDQQIVHRRHADCRQHRGAILGE
jgi:hypothetical protein